MKLNKAIYKNILFIIVGIYAIITMINQQKTLNLYKSNQKELSAQIEDQEEYQQELIATKENINSIEFIEKMAREKLDMYLPNERVYVDKGL